KSFVPVAVLFLAAAALGQTAAPDPTREILWRDASHTDALFIPAARLDVPIDQLPLSEYSRTVLRNSIDRVAHAPVNTVTCRVDVNARGDYEPGAKPIDEWLASARTLVTGDVIGVTAGWNTLGHYAATL